MGLRGFGGLVEGAVGFWAGFCLSGFGFADFRLRSIGVSEVRAQSFAVWDLELRGFGFMGFTDCLLRVRVWLRGVPFVGHLSSFAPVVCKDGCWGQCFVQARRVSMRAEEKKNSVARWRNPKTCLDTLVEANPSTQGAARNAAQKRVIPLTSVEACNLYKHRPDHPTPSVDPWPNGSI